MSLWIVKSYYTDWDKYTLIHDFFLFPTRAEARKWCKDRVRSDLNHMEIPPTKLKKKWAKNLPLWTPVKLEIK